MGYESVGDVKAVRAGEAMARKMNVSFDAAFGLSTELMADHVAAHLEAFDLGPEHAEQIIQDVVARIAEKLQARGHMVEAAVMVDIL